MSGVRGYSDIRVIYDEIAQFRKNSLYITAAEFEKRKMLIREALEFELYRQNLQEFIEYRNMLAARHAR